MDTGFKFQVRWDGRVVVGVTKVSALKRSTEVIEHREGGDPSTSRKSPGLTKFQPIVLKRGVMHDPEFENWANLVYQSGALLGAEVSLKNFRKDIDIELLNEAGQMVSRYRVHRCWPSEYTALPDLDANATEVSVDAVARAFGIARRTVKKYRHENSPHLVGQAGASLDAVMGPAPTER